MKYKFIRTDFCDFFVESHPNPFENTERRGKNLSGRSNRLSCCFIMLKQIIYDLLFLFSDISEIGAFDFS